MCSVGAAFAEVVGSIGVVAVMVVVGVPVVVVGAAASPGTWLVVRRPLFVGGVVVGVAAVAKDNA